MRRKPNGSIQHWSDLRRKIYGREMFACAICGHDGEEIHHIIPKSEGGSDTEHNLVLLCHDCHEKIHNHQQIWIHGYPFSEELITVYLKEYIEGEEDARR